MQRLERFYNRVDQKEPVRGITTEHVARRISFDPDAAPTIYLAVAPCRSGTTAQLRPFAQRGIDAHYQPLKAIERRLMHRDTSAVFTIPSSKEKEAILIKETIGPYTQTESQFNPLDALLHAGYPAEKIKLLVEMRDPLNTLASWMENFSHITSRDALTANFITSVQTVSGIYESANTQGIETVPFVYESLRDNKPENALASLLGELGVSAPVIPEINVNDYIFFAEEPAMYSPPRLHEKFKEEESLKYFPKSEKSLKREISAQQRRALINAGIPTFYEKLRSDTNEVFIHDYVMNYHDLEQFRPRPTVVFAASRGARVLKSASNRLLAAT